MLFLTATLALTSSEAAPPMDVDGIVQRVSIEGVKRIEEPTVRAAMKTRAGERANASSIRRDIKAIFATGYFENVIVEAVAEGDGFHIVFRLEEKPAVRSVNIEGNKKIDEDDIREEIDVRGFMVLNPAAVKKNIEKIRQLYIEKGYFLVDIQSETAWVGEDQVDLTFRIQENRKVIVQRVDFSGNENIPESKIKRYMQTKEGGILPWLTNAGTFKQDQLETDKQTIRYVFWEEGYIDAVVHSPDVFLSPDKRYIFISFQIEEGDRYNIGEIRIAGDFVEEEGLTLEAATQIVGGRPVHAVQDEQWRSAAGKKPALMTNQNNGPRLTAGEPFKASHLEMVRMALEALYQEQGYAFVNVEMVPIPNNEALTADIQIRIDKGEKYRVGKINITGNDPTFDKVVRRELQVNEGDVFRGGRLQASKQRIERLGYFDEVSFSTPRGQGDNVLDVNFNVSEQPTGSFSLGLGFSNLEQFVFTANVSKNNFLGLGYVMSASVHWSRVRRQWQLQFFDPYFLDSRWTMRVNGYNITREFQLNEYQRGGTVEIGRYLDNRDDFRLSVEYTFEDVGLTSLDSFRENMLGGDLYRNGLTSTVGINLNMDKRNNRVRATKGVFASATASLSGGFRLKNGKFLNLLGGDFNFVEGRINLRVFQPIIPKSDRLIFRMNSTLGFVHSTDGRVIPFIHRYRAGGINSVRGYNWFSLGPTVRGMCNSGRCSDDPIHSDDTLIVGGTQTWVNNFEIEAPIIKQAGISGVVFFDAGNAFGDPWGKSNISPLGLRFAYGAGVRWLSPIGPLRFEWGFPINPREGERKSVFDFSIGSFF